MHQISKLLRDFLWRGGKGNHNRMHLVKWETIKIPVLEGRLQIKDPRMSNTSMGGKLLWHLFSNKKTPGESSFMEKISKWRNNSKYSICEHPRRFQYLEFMQERSQFLHPSFVSNPRQRHKISSMGGHN